MPHEADARPLRWCAAGRTCCRVSRSVTNHVWGPTPCDIERPVGRFLGATATIKESAPAPRGVAGPAVSSAVRQLLEAKGIAYHPEHQVTTIDAVQRRVTFANGGQAEFDLRQKGATPPPPDSTSTLP